jgi:nucleoid-associated protein YgaU
MPVEWEQEPQTYTVQAGDTLSKIIQKFYGDANRYMEIYYANRDKIEDPNKLEVGWELTIPQTNQ